MDSSEAIEGPGSVAGPDGRADGECRLGWYVDAVYRRSSDDGELRTISETYPFLIFASAVGAEVGSLTLFGREAPSALLGVDFPVNGSPEFIPLPYYESINDISALVRSVPATARAMWTGLGQVDRVAVFGPHPLSLLLVLLALMRRKGVVLGVRQDTLEYFRARLGRRRAALMIPIRAIDAISRALSRRLPTAVVGTRLERDFRGPRPGLLMLRPTLVAAADLRLRASVAIPDDRPVELLTVGRVAPEKTPETLIRALAELERRAPGRFHLTWIGEGDMMDTARRLASALGVDHAVTMAGFVPYGPELLARYRACDIFVHTARTEGSPQVLIEAMAVGAPVVATAVGGVAALLEDGAAGLLVPPEDSDALAGGIAKMEANSDLRQAVSRRGFAIAESLTLEAEASRFAAFAAPAR